MNLNEELIRAADPAALEELRELTAEGIKAILYQHGAHDEGRAHDAWLDVTRSIQNGELRDDETVIGMVRRIVIQHAARYTNVAGEPASPPLTENQLLALREYLKTEFN
jgi:hypothetical protein